MGNLDDALWIANPEYRAGGVSLFIRAFSVEEKPVRATLTITGLGWFASYLNGERTDDEYFKPLLSDYGERSFEDVRFYRPKGGIKRVYYHTFDVAHLLRAGENRLSVAVAAGWYDHREKPVEGNFAYGRPRLIFSLEYETKKGCGRFVSDGNAFVKSLPAAATLFTGETCDYGGAPGEALAARTVPPPGGMLTPAPIACDRIRRLLTPRVLSRGAGRAVLDFGVNHSGFLRGTLTGPKGGCVTVRYAEDLDAEGEIDHTSTSWGVQVQRDEYILSGHTDAVRTELITVTAMRRSLSLRGRSFPSSPQKCAPRCRLSAGWNATATASTASCRFIFRRSCPICTGAFRPTARTASGAVLRETAM